MKKGIKYLLITLVIANVLFGAYYWGQNTKLLQPIKQTIDRAAGRNFSSYIDKLKKKKDTSQAGIVARTGSQFELTYLFHEKVKLTVKAKGKKDCVVYQSKKPVKEGNLIFSVSKKNAKKLGNKQKHEFIILAGKNEIHAGEFYVDTSDHSEDIQPQGMNAYFVDRTIDLIIRWFWLILAVVVILLVLVTVADKANQKKKEKREKELAKKKKEEKTADLIKKVKEHTEHKSLDVNFVKMSLQPVIKSYIEAIYQGDPAKLPGVNLDGTYYEQMKTYVASLPKNPVTVALPDVTVKPIEETDSYMKVLIGVQARLIYQNGARDEFHQDFSFSNASGEWIMENCSQETRTQQ